MIPSKDKFIGCFLGLAYGDAICAPFEGGPIERLLWRLVGKTKTGELRFTDDTQMSIDIATSFLTEGKIDQEKTASEFASSYKWSRGYGPSAAKVLKRIRDGYSWKDASKSIYPEGSFGNGAAMRAPILAMCVNNSDELFEDTIVSVSEITHRHPLAVEGAMLLAYATSYAFMNLENYSICESLMELSNNRVFNRKLNICINQLSSDKQLSYREIENQLGNGITAEESCVTTIYLGLIFRHRPFIELLNSAKNIGGDTDTIAAMAGAIWGAFNGAQKMLETELPIIEGENDIRDLAIRLHQRYEATYKD